MGFIKEQMLQNSRSGEKMNGSNELFQKHRDKRIRELHERFRDFKAKKIKVKKKYAQAARAQIKNHCF